MNFSPLTDLDKRPWIPGSFQGRVGWGLEKIGIMEVFPEHSKDGTEMILSVPFHPNHDSLKCFLILNEYLSRGWELWMEFLRDVVMVTHHDTAGRQRWQLPILAFFTAEMIQIFDVAAGDRAGNVLREMI